MNKFTGQLIKSTLSGTAIQHAYNYEPNTGIMGCTSQTPNMRAVEVVP